MELDREVPDVGHVEHDLENGCVTQVPFWIQLFDELLERQVLVLIGL